MVFAATPAATEIRNDVNISIFGFTSFRLNNGNGVGSKIIISHNVTFCQEIWVDKIIFLWYNVVKEVSMDSDIEIHKKFCECNRGDFLRESAIGWLPEFYFYPLAENNYKKSPQIQKSGRFFISKNIIAIFSALRDAYRSSQIRRIAVRFSPSISILPNAG